MNKERLTTEHLKELGFTVVRNDYVQIDFKLKDLIISSSQDVNGGGFNHNGRPIDFIDQLMMLL